MVLFLFPFLVLSSFFPFIFNWELNSGPSHWDISLDFGFLRQGLHSITMVSYPGWTWTCLKLQRKRKRIGVVSCKWKKEGKNYTFVLSTRTCVDKAMSTKESPTQGRWGALVLIWTKITRQDAAVTCDNLEKCCQEKKRQIISDWKIKERWLQTNGLQHSRAACDDHQELALAT